MIYKNRIHGLVSRAAEVASQHGVRFLARRTVTYSNNICRVKCRNLLYQARYGSAAPDPYRLIRVSPLDVEYVRVPRFSATLPTTRDGTYIIGGSWDREHSDRVKYEYNLSDNTAGEEELIALDNFVFYRSARRHFCEGISWKSTELYKFIKENGRSMDLKSFDRLYEEISENGYLSQRYLERSASEDEINHLHRNPSRPPEHNEVYVNIGRDGQLVLDEGKHRFTIARLLRLNEIPCRVLVRHEKWQEKRKQVAHGDVPDGIDLTHPDLQDVRPSG